MLVGVLWFCFDAGWALQTAEFSLKSDVYSIQIWWHVSWYPHHNHVICDDHWSSWSSWRNVIRKRNKTPKYFLFAAKDQSFFTAITDLYLLNSWQVLVDVKAMIEVKIYVYDWLCIFILCTWLWWLFNCGGVCAISEPLTRKRWYGKTMRVVAVKWFWKRNWIPITHCRVCAYYIMYIGRVGASLIRLQNARR